MRVAVCIKQVPIVSAMKFDSLTRTLARAGVACEVSSFDIRALLKAIELRNLHGGEVVVLTMGPPQANEALLECLALGADRAIHLSDRQFAGADTLATARVLAAALRRDEFDLILCGRYSVDAETGQVGPEIAEMLGMAQITAAQSIDIDLTRRMVQARRETDTGSEVVEAPLPVLVTATEDLAAERFASKAEREAGKNKRCDILSAADLELSAESVGSQGSPTWVAELQEVHTSRRGHMIEAATPSDAARELVRLLVDEHRLLDGLTTSEQPTLASIPRPVTRPGPKDIWVLAESRGKEVRQVTLELLGKARQLADALQSSVTVVCLGHDIADWAVPLGAHGADRILIGDHPHLRPYASDTHTQMLAAAIQAQKPGMLLMAATNRGRDLAPRLAARLQLGLTGDCVDLGLDAEGRLLQYKPAFGGSVVAPILSRTIPELATIRPGMLAASAVDPQRHASVERLDVASLKASKIRVVADEPSAIDTDDLETADIVIGVGMGLGDKGALEGVQSLARRLGAGLCTTRDVVDAGWLPRHLQVGLTGRAIAPKLYLAIAIRGAFEHMVGVRRAGLVVAINKNAKAPVFKQADYGIVADYRAVLPALDAELARHKL